MATFNIRNLVAGLSVLGLAFAGLVNALPAQAAGNADLNVTLTVPTAGNAGESYTAEAEIRNAGPDAANDTEFEFQVPRLTKTGKVECVEATGGAECPRLIAGGKSVMGTIVTFPSGGVVKLRVVDRLPDDTNSAVSELSVSNAKVTDPTPENNTVQQQTAINTVADVNYAISSDQPALKAGEKTNVKIRYENKSDIYLEGIRVNFDSLNVPAHAAASITCDPASTAPCPTWADGTVKKIDSGGETRFFGGVTDEITLPKRTTLILNLNLDMSPNACRNDDLNTMRLWGFFERNDKSIVTFKKGQETVEYLTASHQLDLDLPTCKPIPVRMAKELVGADKVEVGKPMTWKVTYENLDNVSQDLTIGEYPDRDLPGSYKTQVACDADSSTMECPAWVAAYGTKEVRHNTPHFLESTRFPAGKKLTLLLTTTYEYPPSGMQCLPPNKTLYFNGMNMASKVANVQMGTGKAANIITTHKSVPLDGTPCQEATVRLSASVDKAQVALGEERVNTVTVENLSQHNIEGLPISYRYYLTHSQARHLYRLECDASSTAPCPSWVAKLGNKDLSRKVWSFIGQGQGNDGLVDGQLPRINLGAKQKLILKVYETNHVAQCENLGVASGQVFTELGEAQNLKVNVEGQERHLEQKVTVNVDCNDISTNTSVSNARPNTADPIEVTSVITSGVGTALGTQVQMAFNGGIEFASDVQPSCEATAGATCPQDLKYDPQTQLMTGTIENLPQGSVVTFKLAGKASSPSLSQPTFQVKTTAIAPKEVEKVDSMRNLSSATWENPVARHSLQVTHQLLLENSDGTQVPLHLDAPLQFAGKLAQTTTDVIDASIVLQAGQDSATSVITTKIPQGADVTLAVQRPQAPAGYEWIASTPVEGRELFSNVQENTEKTFTWVLKKKVDPVVPPKPSDPQPEKPQSDGSTTPQSDGSGTPQSDESGTSQSDGTAQSQSDSGTAKPAQEIKPPAQQSRSILAVTGFETGSVAVASFFLLGMGALLLVAVKRRNA